MTDFYDNPEINDPMNPQGDNGTDDFPDLQVAYFNNEYDNDYNTGYDIDYDSPAGNYSYGTEPGTKATSGNNTTTGKNTVSKKNTGSKKNTKSKKRSRSGKERSVGLRVFIIILKTFITVILMVGVGLISYYATMKYYEVTEKPKKENPILDVVSEATADEISRNIIYSVDEEKSKIEAIVIEVLNTNTGNLDYITIPAQSQFSLSNDLFRRLFAAEVDIPQIVTLSSLRKYIKDDTAYEYGMLILEEHFGIDLGYYTEMSSDVFDSIFTYSKDTGYYMLSDGILGKASGITEKKDMESFIKEQSDSFSTNIQIKSKLKYAETYLAVDPELIYYYVMPGEEKGDIYEPDAKQAYKLYEAVLMDMPHKTKQEKVKMISSDDKKIKVLNGCGGEGTAGKVKGILETEGFKVAKIADNPKIVEKTIIYVKEEGMGKDLLSYFNGAIIETGVPDKDFDIVIVIGTKDKDITAPEQSE